MQRNNISGLLLINKHKGVTSFDIVSKIRRLYNIKKVGHTGTLDPLATGVLPVLVGPSVKASEYLLNENKEYIATLKLGIETDTEDITGKVLNTCDVIPDFCSFKQACDSFLGTISQVPPMYSAIKIDGKKLVDLARNGVTIEREKREVRIESIIPEIIDEKEGIYSIDVKCSKGTYIRTLCSDIGKKLGCGATMTELERVKSGPFSIDDCISIEELENLSYEERLLHLIPLENVFSDYDSIGFPDFYTRLFKNGCEIYLKKINRDFEVGKRLKVFEKGMFIALAEVKEFDEGLAIKAIKYF